MQLVVNLSMLGHAPTGLGVYSNSCYSALAERFLLEIICGAQTPPRGRIIATAPSGLGIRDTKVSSLRRGIWLRSVRVDKNRLIYTPTHHGLPGICEQIITVHDLIPLRFPSQNWRQYLYFKWLLPRLIFQSRAVFTVSETTRRDIVRTWAFPQERVFVVPNAVDTRFFFPASTSATKSPFLLVVGATFPHKNIEELLENADIWKRDFRLEIVAPISAYRHCLYRLAIQAGIADRVTFHDSVSQVQLRNLYRSCAALIYPSLWEGFGIPPLEAFACGKPVIASDIPPHREVLGDAAHYVTLGDARSWYEALSAIRTEPTPPAKLHAMADAVRRFPIENQRNALIESLLAVEPTLAQNS